MVKDFYIKNMVCDRCIKVLRDVLDKQTIELLQIELGRLRLNIESDDEIEKLKTLLESNGFSLIGSTEEKRTEQVKVELIKALQKLPLELDKKLSAHLADALGHEYSKISKVFSITEGITIEKYFITSKIYRVQETVPAKRLHLAEMALLLTYNQKRPLSDQIKSQTGMSLKEHLTQVLSSRLN